MNDTMAATPPSYPDTGPPIEWLPPDWPPPGPDQHDGGAIWPPVPPAKEPPPPASPPKGRGRRALAAIVAAAVVGLGVGYGVGSRANDQTTTQPTASAPATSSPTTTPSRVPAASPPTSTATVPNGAVSDPAVIAAKVEPGVVSIRTEAYQAGPFFPSSGAGTGSSNSFCNVGGSTATGPSCASMPSMVPS